MTVQGVGSAAVFTPGIGNGTPQMTPEALMLYCSSRMGDLDAQIDRHFAEQKRVQNANDKINVLAQTLRGSMGGVGANINEHRGDLLLKMNAAINSLPIGHPQRIELEGMRRSFVSTAYLADGKVEPHHEQAAAAGNFAALEGFAPGHGNNVVSADEIRDTYIKNVESIQSALGKGAELSMIQLQSTMSQRQMAIQLCTDLVKKLGEMQTSIVRNVGA